MKSYESWNKVLKLIAMAVYSELINNSLKRIHFIPYKLYSTYTQGQFSPNNIREYFYYIDHQGMLFLDDARIKNFTSCFKDKQFLSFFFHRLRSNNTDKYLEFPYLSPCGRERNYVRCDDCPIVFTRVLSINNEDMFCYNHALDLLMFPFEPNKIYMHPENGRIYHPGPKQTGSIGLVQSKLAIEFSKFFTFAEENKPTHFTWSGKTYELDTRWIESLENHTFYKEN